MSGRNKRAGTGFEYRRLREVDAVRGAGFRRYASKGIVDICYVDRKGIAHLEQCKYSSKGNAKISSDELATLIGFAGHFIGLPCHVSLAVKNAYKKTQVYRLNVSGLENVQTFGDLKRFYGEKK